MLTNRVKQMVEEQIIKPIPQLSSHSLRRGGATHLRTRDMPDWLIQQLGRWNSDAFKLYTDHSWRQVLGKLEQAYT